MNPNWNEFKREFDQKYGLDAFFRHLTKDAAAYDEDRDWEVNSKHYAKKEGNQSEYDFMNKTRFLAGRAAHQNMEKEEQKMNRFLDKKANQEDPTLAETLTFYGGGGAGLGGMLGHEAAQAVKRGGEQAQQGIHPDIDQMQMSAAKKEILKKILASKASFASSAIANSPGKAALSFLGGGMAAGVGLQLHDHMQNGSLNLTEEELAEDQLPKTAFYDLRESLEKVAHYYSKK